jgi:hypothetical protein
MAADGSTYESKWEAEDVNARLEGPLPEVETVEAQAPQEPSVLQRLWGVLILGGMTLFLGLITIAGPIQAYEGKIHLKHDWMWIAAPFVWFVFVGLALQCAASFVATATGKDVGDDKVFDWWMEKVGCGILTLVGWLVGLGLAWLVITKLFEGVGKGQVLIIILLAGILIALSQNAASRR